MTGCVHRWRAAGSELQEVARPHAPAHVHHLAHGSLSGLHGGTHHSVTWQGSSWLAVSCGKQHSPMHLHCAAPRTCGLVTAAWSCCTSALKLGIKIGMISAGSQVASLSARFPRLLHEPAVGPLFRCIHLSNCLHDTLCIVSMSKHVTRLSIAPACQAKTP